MNEIKEENELENEIPNRYLDEIERENNNILGATYEDAERKRVSGDRRSVRS